eukprot:TRINITY_DN18901_c0_g1_i1.p1 TRINITY_DN18901_c0_g1~~TRINITY_DN18901_c0_g1_i1.p1  ORF type:complete len:778 (+),score=135.98 TRINITY_DN18901_c0_g1_i1:129-2336(+)
MHTSKRSLFETYSSKNSSFNSQVDSTEHEREYPSDAASYQLLEEAGRGVSAHVWKALCKPFNQIVAIKVLDLENVNCRLDEVIREAQAMKNFQHPNVLTLLTSFVNGRELWMVMPFMSGGSILNIIKYEYPSGLPEPLIAYILREVLKGLEYLHKNNTIHRDVKAGNILVGHDGRVLLGDFGVVAQLERGDQRKTFVGTPCWMAPEVMEQMEGYGTSADIWSFGITMLELAHGHAPFAKYPPMKVLLMTLQNPPPTLQESSGRHFSKSMKEVVQKCLNKDANRRPTAAQLMDMRFFKHAAKSDALVDLVHQLPDLTERVKRLNEGRVPHHQGSKERSQKSNEEYIKGVSSWDFNVDALKQQAEEEPNPALANVASTVGGAALGAVLGRSITQPIIEEETSFMAQGSAGDAVAGATAVAVLTKAGPATAGAISAASAITMNTMVQEQQQQTQQYHHPQYASPPDDQHHHSHSSAQKAKQRQVGRFTVLDNVENSPADTRGAQLMETHLKGLHSHTHPKPIPEIEPPTQSPQQSLQQQQQTQQSQQQPLQQQQSKGKSRFTVVQQEPASEQYSEKVLSDGSRKSGSKQSIENVQNVHSSNALVFDKAMYQAIPRLQEIQEAQRTLADAHNSLLAAINEAQKGKKEMLAKYVAHPYIKVISGKQLQEFDQIKDFKNKLSQLQEENQSLREQLNTLQIQMYHRQGTQGENGQLANAVQTSIQSQQQVIQDNYNDNGNVR